MIRSSRLTATILAALFAAILTTTAYAGVARCHRTVNGTKFNDLNGNGKRDSGEPGLAGWRIWADYDDDGVRDTGEPYDDTDSLGRYSLVVTRTDGLPPARAAPRRRHRRLEVLVPERLDLRRLRAPARAATSAAAGARSPSDAVNGKDFGNYKQPKITVIKKLVPASDPGRFDLKVDSTTVKAAAGDGGSGSTLVSPGAHLVSETAAAGTDLADYSASIACNTATVEDLRAGLGPRRSRATRSPARSPTPASARSRSPRSPTRTRRAARSSASPASRAPSASPDGGVKTITARAAELDALRGDRVGRLRLPALVDHLHRQRQHRRGGHAHREHQGRAGRDRPLHVRQHEARPGHRGRQVRPGGRAPRRQDGLLVRRAQRRQHAAARRQGHRRQVLAGLGRPGHQDRRRPGRAARGRRGVDLHLHQDRPDPRRGRDGSAVQRRHRHRQATSRTSRSATPTSTARTSSTRRSRSRRSPTARPRRWATRSATGSTSPTPVTPA